MLLKVIPLNSVLQDLNDLFACIFLETRVVLAHLTSFGHLPSLIIYLLVDLCQVLVKASRDTDQLLVPI